MPVEGAVPMGTIMRQHWIPRACRKKLRNATANPLGFACWVKIVVFRDSEAVLVQSTSSAVTAARHSPLAATRIAACAVSITAGNST